MTARTSAIIWTRISRLWVLFGLLLVAACQTGQTVPEVWTFNANGDIPEAAKDQVNLQAAIVDDESVSTTGVDNVIAELPNGVQLEGFHSVNMSVDGTDVDAPLLSALLHWPVQPIDEVAETAADIADALGMDPADVAAWAAQQGDNGRPTVGGQTLESVDGLHTVELTYQALGAGEASATVTLYWPRFVSGS